MKMETKTKTFFIRLMVEAIKVGTYRTSDDGKQVVCMMPVEPGRFRVETTGKGGRTTRGRGRSRGNDYASERMRSRFDFRSRAGNNFLESVRGQLASY